MALESTSLLTREQHRLFSSAHRFHYDGNIRVAFVAVVNNEFQSPAVNGHFIYILIVETGMGEQKQYTQKQFTSCDCVYGVPGVSFHCLLFDCIVLQRNNIKVIK